MYWTKASWTNGKRTITGSWIYQWHSDTFHIVLDSIDPITRSNRKLQVKGDSPQWGKWKLNESK